VNFFCGAGLSTWGSRTAGVHSAIAFDAFPDVLKQHAANHHGGDDPSFFVLTTDTTEEMVEEYLKSQPPLSCCHFQCRVGSNVSQEWYDPHLKRRRRLAKLSKVMISHILTIKCKLIAAALPANNVIHFIGVATPPCYDVSTANPDRTEEFGFATMSSCFELLNHCFRTHLLATYW
jgi:site-specific DNA-cytosine methylase